MKKGVRLEDRVQDEEPTTIVLPASLDWYIAFHSIKTARPKGKIVKEAVASYLTRCGYKNIDEIPEEFPKKEEIVTEVIQDEVIARLLDIKATNRTTIFMKPVHNLYLRYHALITKRSRGKIITEAIALYLLEQGHTRLDTIPSRIDVKY